MDVVGFAKHVYKKLDEHIEALSDHVTSGGPKDNEAYRQAVGEIRGLTKARQEIRASLENYTDDDEFDEFDSSGGRGVKGS